MKHIFFVILFFSCFKSYSGNYTRPRNCLKESIGTARITGFVPELKNGDSVSLYIYDETFISEFETKYLPPIRYAEPVRNGSFAFNISDISEIRYFSIKINSTTAYDRGKPIVKFYLIEPNDDIEMHLVTGKLLFKGPGSEKYNCRMELDETKIESRKKPEFLISNQEREILSTIHNNFIKADALRKLNKSILDKYRGFVSESAYYIMLVDMISKSQRPPVQSALINLMNGSMLENEFSDISNYLKEYLINVDDIPFSYIDFSKDYLLFVSDLEKTEYILRRNSDISWFKTFKEKYTGYFRERLIISILLHGADYMRNFDSLANDAISTVITRQEFSSLLISFGKKLKTSVAAPDFSLPDVNGNVIKLSDFTGKVIFLDFWYTGCGPCLLYYKHAVQKAKEKFHGSDEVIFMSISIDIDKKRWITSINSNKYSSPEAVNLYTEGLGSSHPIFQKYLVTGYPTPLLIGRDGKIITRNNFELGQTSTPDPQKLIQAISSAIQK